MVGSGSALKRSIFEFLGIWTPEGGDAIIILGDNAGAKKLIVKDSDGNVIGYLNSNGELSLELDARLKEVTEPSTPSSGYAVMYIDTADKKLKLKDDTGTVTDLTAPGPESATDYRDFTEQGSIPATPASNKWRVWIDATGEIHIIEDDGTDRLIARLQRGIDLRSNAMPSPYYYLDGINDKIDTINNTNDYATDDFSILVRFYIISLPGGGPTGIFIKGTTEDSWGIQLESTGYLTGGIRGSSTKTLSTAAALILNQWHNVVFVYSVTGTSYIYLNGNESNSADLTGSGYSFTTENIRIGNQVISGSPSYPNMLIDYVGLFTKALTVAEVEEFQNSSIPWKYRSALGDLVRTTYNAGSFIVDRSYRIVTVGTTDFTLIGASSNTIGIEFVATGVGSGDGTALRIGLALKFSPAGMGHKQWQETELSMHGEVIGPSLGNTGLPHSELYTKLAVTGETTLTDIQPAGYEIVSAVYKETSGNTITNLDIGYSDGGGEIVAAANITGSTTSSFTLLKRVATLTAADTIYISATNWNGGSVDIYFVFRRIK